MEVGLRMTILDKLEALEKAATPGPWRTGVVDTHRCYDEHGFVTADGFSTPTLDGRSLRQRAADQAAFIVAYRNHAQAIMRVLRAAMAVDKNAMPSGLPYPIVPAKDINELHDALRALDGAGGAK